MNNHLRANLWLLLFTIVLCSVLYPLTLWAIGQNVFHEYAQGSLIKDQQGKVIGSRLIAQPFTQDEFFQPRPSAASYNAAQSGASNWGASTYLLRDRVARQLGPIVRYGKGAEAFGKKPGDGVQADIEVWFQNDRFQNKPGIVAQWAAAHPGLAEAWIKNADESLKTQWKENGQDRKTNESFVMQWKADDPDIVPNAASDIAKSFFASFCAKHPGAWPALEDYETKEKQKKKRFVRTKTGVEIQAVFFDMWRQDNPKVPLEPVPADMVTASGSGLDPHITLDNARYQLKHRIAAAQADKLIAAEAEPILNAKKDRRRQEILTEVRAAIEARLGGKLEDKIRRQIETLLEERKEAPLGGLAGVPIVNVLELNLALRERMPNFGLAR